MSTTPILLEAARNLAASGHLDDAEFAYSKILAADPAELEAVAFVSMRAMTSSRFSRAIEVLERAVHLVPDSSELQRELGIAHKVSGRPDAAMAPLQRAAQLDPQDYLSRLLIGQTLETLGHSYGALTNYFGALVIAQTGGAWLDEATTPPGHRELVKHAGRYVGERRLELLSHVLAPMHARHGRDSMQRVDEAVAIYLGEAPPNYVDDRQRPLFLYFPGLPTKPLFDRAQFSWVSALEDCTTPIRDELSAVLADRDGLEPFHGAMSDDKLRQYLAGSHGGKPNWDGYFFYRHGVRHETNCDACPKTIAAIDRLPIARIRDHAPEAMFSVLTPGTHILPHRGVTNTRLVVHLPLIVPEDCAIVVGGEMHVWREGQVMVFDDTFEHEAWNRSERTRAVLILDVWNPYLDEAERDALTLLVPAIGDFNRDCGL